MSVWVSGRGLEGAAGGDRVQRREPAGERLGLRQRALVDLRPDRLLPQPQGAYGVPAVVQRLALELEAQAGRVL